jgi:PKD repeat protein
MRKKIGGIFVMMLLLLSGVFLPIQNRSSGDPLPDEVLDQVQETCGSCDFFDNYAWQAFVPSMTNLVRVEVCIAQNFGLSPDITLSVEQPLETPLTSMTLPVSAIPSGGCDWVSFDVSDIALTPGETYYLVLSYPLGGEYSWCGAPGDLYVPGNSNKEIGWDWCFRTLSAAEEITGPDLVVTDIWNEDDDIWYQLRNVGNIPADAGHSTALYVDDVYQLSDSIAEMLNPGERLNRVFDYQWECTPLYDTIEVRADEENIVLETNETNNNRVEQWNCDTLPPEITSGPLAQNITLDSAMISWETNEDSDSRVFCGTVSGFYTDGVTNESLASVHHVTLQGLVPSTTYHFRVESADLTGNNVQSSDLFFETAPAPDGIPPVIDVEELGECQQSVLVTANAQDNQGVEKVIFYINNISVFTDYSAPFEFVWGTTRYPNGVYDVKSRVVDLMGQTSEDHASATVANLIDETVPQVRIMYPHTGETLTDDVLITAYLQDDVDLKEGICYIDGIEHARTTYPEQIDYVAFTYLWDTYDVGNGPHRIGVVTNDSDGKTATGYVDILVDNPPRPQPDLKVIQHSVSQYHNRATIKVIVQNVGASTARNVTVIDYLSGFYPVSDVYGNVNYTAKYDPAKRISSCIIHDTTDLLSNEVRQYEYYAIPILFDPLPSVSIGFVLHLEYETMYQEKIMEAVPFAVDTKNANDAYTNALQQSDYLLLTNPWRLFTTFGGEKGGDKNVSTLLSAMAELAYFRDGVLGFVNTTDRDMIRNLIIPGGAWEAKMHSSTNQLFYLLLVGETEIVPSFRQTNFIDNHPNCPATEVDLSDLFYANTVGDGAPELAVGRIIGNQPVNLARVMQTSINVLTNQSGYGFDRSHALFISGTDGNASFQDFFKSIVNELANITSKEFIVEKLHFSDCAWFQRVDAFRSSAVNQDVICFEGHGSPDVWDQLNTIDFSLTPPISFGNTNPFVFAISCLTGSYENHTANVCHYAGGDYNIAEAFFDAKAGVYIGATEISWGGPNAEAVKFFFKALWNPGSTIGESLLVLKNTLWSQPGMQFWSAEYNLYGDPKYGKESAEVSGAGDNGEPTSSVDVQLPAYEMTSQDGYDYVEIPGGEVLMAPGNYRVPYDMVSLQYPPGVQIQDVILIEKSTLSTNYGVNLPLIQDFMNCPCGDPLSPDDPPIEEWYPCNEYKWNVDENTDGSSTLHILIYPMKYNPLTTALQYYRNYSFAINYTESPVTIVTMTTDKDEYHGGDDVRVDVEVNNTGPSKDVIVNAVIRQSATDDVVSGLLLSTLHDFSGSASFSPQWDSEGTPPGYYYVEVTLSDIQGRLLDRKTSLFGLDLTMGDITAFSVSPQYFDIGDMVSIDLTFTNTGSVSFNGTAYTNIQDMDGNILHTFLHTITDLQAMESFSSTDQWDSSSAQEGSYKVVSYVLYESRSSETMVQLISTNYPPVVRFTYTPQHPILLEQPVHFDTAGSFDPDGSILSWYWDFGDGSMSTEQNPTHTYHHPGTYIVTLMITDNEGATNTTSAFLVVGDFTPPSITVEVPDPWEALQDGVTFLSLVTDGCGVEWVKYSIREPGGAQGTIIDSMYEALDASAAANDKWELLFETTQLPDGYYVLHVNASDTCGNEGNTTVNFSIRNWAVIELLPNTPNSKAGRTIPVKFSLRITAAVDPTEPFVRNEELTIEIYVKGHPETILQISTYGTGAKDYRINEAEEHYITNFQTLKTPKTYIVEIWRDTLLIGSFEFTTVK